MSTQYKEYDPTKPVLSQMDPKLLAHLGKITVFLGGEPIFTLDHATEEEAEQAVEQFLHTYY